jgi:hypothetical protein
MPYVEKPLCAGVVFVGDSGPAPIKACGRAAVHGDFCEIHARHARAQRFLLTVLRPDWRDAVADAWERKRTARAEAKPRAESRPAPTIAAPKADKAGGTKAPPPAPTPQPQPPVTKPPPQPYREHNARDAGGQAWNHHLSIFLGKR